MLICIICETIVLTNIQLGTVQWRPSVCKRGVSLAFLSLPLLLSFPLPFLPLPLPGSHPLNPARWPGERCELKIMPLATQNLQSTTYLCHNLNSEFTLYANKQRF